MKLFNLIIVLVLVCFLEWKNLKASAIYAAVKLAFEYPAYVSSFLASAR